MIYSFDARQLSCRWSNGPFLPFPLPLVSRLYWNSRSLRETPSLAQKRLKLKTSVIPLHDRRFITSPLTLYSIDHLWVASGDPQADRQELAMAVVQVFAA